MSDHQTVWSFDLGKGSIGEAVRDIKSNKFLHKASLLIPAEFASTKEATTRRRMWRTRIAHKAREKWLDEVWLAAGLEPLKTRKPGKNPKTGKWDPKQLQEANYRIEREFAPQNKKIGRDGAPADGTICYTSCLLRIKLLRGERLEAWQIYKALHSAIQKRGYGRVPWAAREEKRSGKTEEEQEKELKKLDPDYREAVETWPKFKQAVGNAEFHLPCYYDAWRMGLWSFDQPDVLGSRITCQAGTTRKVRFDRADVEREIATLAQQAATQLPQLADAFAKWKHDGWKSMGDLLEATDCYPVAAKSFGEFFVHGPAGEPTGDAQNNFSDYLKFRTQNKIHPGSGDDWMGATAQKTPRFDNRIINTCALIPRLQVCNVTVRFKKSDNTPIPESLLATEVTFLLKLKNTPVSSGSGQRKLTVKEIYKIFEIVSAEALAKALSLAPDDKYREKKVTERYALKESNWFKIKGIKELGLRPLAGHEEIKAPKTEGRSRFSRSALRLIRALILNGLKPSAFHQRLIAHDSALLTEIGMDIFDNEPIRQKVKLRESKKRERSWVLSSDLKFLSDLKNNSDTWENIYFPEQRLDALETRYTNNDGKVNVPQAVKELLGSINDPVVRHRLEVFSDRLTKLRQGHEKEGIPACGIPETVVLEFVREDFMGKRAKDALKTFINDREKARTKAREQAISEGVHEKSGRLKFELFNSQGGFCLYCQQPLKQTDLANHEIDHIVPRSKDGPDAMVNYVLAHRDCNDTKAERTPYQWKHIQEDWDGYKAFVEKYATTLRNKKVQLLLREDAPELVKRYTALAETAWISKLAQKIVSLHFGWRNGIDKEGERRVIVVSGGLTARIRRKYRLNSLLNPAPPGTTDQNEWEAKAEKNRKDDRHHALDAMVINFLPQWMRDEKKGWFFQFPEPVKKNPRGLFENEINEVVPRHIAFEKPRLEEKAYGLRETSSEKSKRKSIMVRRLEKIEDLLYKTDNNQKVFDKSLKTAYKRVQNILDPAVRHLFKSYLDKNRPSEKGWNEAVQKGFLHPNGSHIRRLVLNRGNPEEYKNIAKDDTQAWKRGEPHKGQIVYLNAEGKIDVAPVYAHGSVAKQIEKIELQGGKVKICGFFQSECAVRTTKSIPASKYKLVVQNEEKKKRRLIASNPLSPCELTLKTIVTKDSIAEMTLANNTRVVASLDVWIDAGLTRL